MRTPASPSFGTARACVSRPHTWLVLYLALAGTAAAQSNSLAFDRLTVADGLPSNQVNALLQDSRGYVWLATFDGLSRYDGQDFRVFSADLDDPNRLSKPAVGWIEEDSRGRIWIGGDGLVDRFDPATGRITRAIVPTDGIHVYTSLLESTAGDFWISAVGGVYRLDAETDSYRLVRPNPTHPDSLFHGIVTDLEEDPNGSIWITTSDISQEGVFRVERLRPGTDYFELMHEGPTASSFFRDRRGELHFMRNNALYRFDAPSDAFVEWFDGKGLDEVNPNPRMIAFAPHEDRLGNFWFPTWRGGLSRLEGATGEFRRFLPDEKDPNAIMGTSVFFVFEDADSALWLTVGDPRPFGNKGVQRLNPETLETEHFHHDPTDPQSLASNEVTDMLVDRESTLWIATSDGVSRLSRAARGMRLIRLPPSSPAFGPIKGITQTRDGRLWLGGGEGLYTVDLQTGQPTLEYRDRTPELGPFRKIMEDEAGDLWLMRSLTISGDGRAQNAGISRFSPSTWTYRRWQPGPGSRSRVFDAVLDRAGNLWYAGLHGVGRFDPHTETFQRIPRQTAFGAELDFYSGNLLLDAGGRVVTAAQGLYRLDPYSPQLVPVRPVNGPSDHVNSAWSTGPSELWGAMREGGLRRYDLAAGTDTLFRHDPSNPKSLSSDRVSIVFESAIGTVWVGTENGLNRYEPDTRSFERLHAGNGLASSHIVSLQEGPAGQLLVGTIAGYSVLDPVGGSVARIVRPSGDPVGVSDRGPTRRGGSLILRDGTMVLGIKDAVILVDPTTQADPLAPLIAFESLRVFEGTGGAELSRLYPDDGSAIELSFRERNLSIDYTALHFKRPAENRYAWKLEPSSREWREVGTERTATFTNLKPGSYIFRVRASNSDGVWNESGISLALAILPPWWQTGWAYGVYVVATLFFLLAILRLQRARIVRRERAEARIREAQVKAEAADERAEFLAELNQMKSRFYGNVSHEFRTPLTLTLGPLEDVLHRHRDDLPEEAGTDLELAVRSARRLLRLTDQILDVAKLEGGHLRLEPVPGDLSAYLREISGYFAPLAAQRGIRYDVVLPDAVLVADYDPKELEKVFINLLSNAFKFTPDAGTVRFLVEHLPDSVTITIINSGPGIPAERLEHIFERFYQVPGASLTAQAGTGIGLALVKELVELHDGSITASSEQGISTRFAVTLPLSTGDIASAHEAPISEAATRLISDLLLTHAVEKQLAEPAPGSKMVGSGQDQVTILVVDDDADMRAFISRRLGPAYCVVEASDGQEALETAKRVLPDVVISDVLMPRMNGYELCAALKNDPAVDYVPVVLVTAKTEREDRLQGLRQGADRYLTKPFDEQELLLSVENLLARTRRLRDLYSPDPVEVHASKVGAVPVDQAFLESVREAIESHIEDVDFGVVELAAAVGQSRSTLHRHLKGLLHTTPSHLIRRIRIERAQQLLDQRAGTISEVAYAVGYQSVSYFSRCFRDHFGQTPSEYLAQVREQQGNAAESP